MPTTIRTSVIIDASPEAITKFILDPDKTVLWTSDLERYEVLSGTPGQIGSFARLHYRQGNRSYVMEDRLLETEPGRRYLSRVSGDVLTAEVETTLEPSGQGTSVAIRWTGSGRGLFRFLLPFMRGSISRQASNDLEKLKAAVERETHTAA